MCALKIKSVLILLEPKTYYNFETVRNWLVTKRASFGFGFVNFQELFRFWNSSSCIVYKMSQVKCLFTGSAV